MAKNGRILILYRGLGSLELLDFEIMLLQKIIEVCPIFSGQLGGLTYIALGHGENLY
jgi:hypothetical protein